jgi:CO/xanthine dehydrogenase Mo-binding subunit
MKTHSIIGEPVKGVETVEKAGKKAYSVIGKPVINVEAAVKAAGEASFTGDIKPPGMLHGKTKRSPHPFAKILSIDTSKARKLPGVRAVITAQDVTQKTWGHYVADERPLTVDYVHYVGDEVAAVAADDIETAEEALELIEVTYEELEPVLHLEGAMEPDAPPVHPELPHIKNNIAYTVDFVRGEGDAAFSQADLVLEERYITHAAYHAYLERQACISHWSGGKLTVWASTQAPFRARMYMSQALSIPEHKIRIIQPNVGGGFGGKISINHIFPISALLSMKTGRPVKIELSREEDFMTGRARISTQIDLKMGFKKDGTIVAKSSVIIADTGASAGTAPSVLAAAAVRPDNLYRIAHIKCLANLVYTNKAPRGPFRGYGNTETTFAQESMIDVAAEKLGIDPVELRLKNATQKGDVTAHGWIINSCGLSESLQRAAEESGWKEKRQKLGENRGIGVACQVHVGGNRAVHPIYDGSGAIVRIDQNGKVQVVSGESEIGQGAYTLFAQIASEEIGVSVEDVEVLPVDSNHSPYCLGAWASRTSILGGNAVRMAANDAKRQLLKHAAEQFGADVEDIEVKDGKFYLKGTSDERAKVNDVAFRAVFEMGGVPIIGKGTYTVPDYVVVPDKDTKYGNYSIGYSFSTQIAEVEVDPETGKVVVLDFWVGEDVGWALNPKLCEGQIEGGVVQGLGWALMEDYAWANGALLNPNFTDYKIPTFATVPRIHSILIEPDEPGGPYGAKSVGEAVLNPVAPAIANAVYDAVGARINSLPLGAERVFDLLKARRNPAY